MTHSELIRIGLRYQHIAELQNAKIHIAHGRSNYVPTSYGLVHVLEYGFERNAVKPLYINLPGGGFVMHNVATDDKLSYAIAQMTGIKVVSIDYPRAPQQPFPAAINAVLEIIAHYRNNSQLYGIDGENIGIGGQSAGANIAAVICIKTADNEHFAPMKFQVLNYPPLDLSSNPYERPSPAGSVPPQMMDALYRCYHGGDPVLFKSIDFSPLYATNEQLAELPPTFILVASRDSLHDDGVQYYYRLNEVGISVDLHDFNDSKHGFLHDTNSTDVDQAIKLIASFIMTNAKCALL